MMIVIYRDKKLAGRRANQLARCLANAVGKLRIVYRSRQDQRANQGRGDTHRLVMSRAPAPFGELTFDEADDVLDAPARGAAHFGLLAWHFAPCRGDGASLLRSGHMPVGKVGVDERDELLARLRHRDRPSEGLD